MNNSSNNKLFENPFITEHPVSKHICIKINFFGINTKLPATLFYNYQECYLDSLNNIITEAIIKFKTKIVYLPINLKINGSFVEHDCDNDDNELTTTDPFDMGINVSKDVIAYISINNIKDAISLFQKNL